MKSSRTAAIGAGDPHYNTGKPCKYGHFAPRYTIDGSCTECRNERVRAERDHIREVRATTHSHA